ncbi:LpxI family protein [Methyloceanibacter sp.]|uniref:LpxI family protein n=1 Tax=Methyloceanibacter sp. TaxID=1965321 RepID=UPI002D39B33E|nr:UDP-2,3-diacylglucosamine diphosphatase LpxI [Methyloceanibacter sp.]HZP09915.1 UDP-2,3-diacylglucosamine diphosphatase LpxI [Methyloceanibacter sp.]
MSRHRTDDVPERGDRSKRHIDGPLGIVAGRGPLPCLLAEAATARGLPVHIVGIRGEASDEIERFSHTWMKWGELGKLFGALDDHGCRDLVIVGGVNRPDLANVKFDFTAVKHLPFLLSLGKGGDDNILSRIVDFFEQKGYRVHGPEEVLPDLLVGVGILGDKAPSGEDRADIELGFRVVASLGHLDIGQAAVIAKGHVLAVEAAEGTDAMLARIVELRQSGRVSLPGRAGVLVKAPKPGQEQRIDLPTIGSETVRRAAAAGLAGIAVAAGQVLVAELARTIDAANRQGLFLVGEPVPQETKSSAP